LPPPPAQVPPTPPTELESLGRASQIPLPRPSTSSPPPQRPSTSSQENTGTQFYVVQPGDSLSVIAEKFGLKTEDLKALNNLTDNNIRPGQRLTVR
jgi:LysM repeat protein